jgi:hypothetical protein
MTIKAAVIKINYCENNVILFIDRADSKYKKLSVIISACIG